MSAAERILWVTKPLEPPFNDGAKVAPRALLARMDLSAVAICVSRPPPAGTWGEALETVSVYSDSRSFIGRRAQNARVFGFLAARARRYRALHFFFAPNPTSSRAARSLKKLHPRVPFIQTIMSRPRSFEDADALLFGDIVIAQSEHTRRSFGRDDIALIRPAIDLLAIDLAPSRPPRTLLFAGDIDHGGALPHLARIVPRLLDAAPELRFIFSVREKGGETRARAAAFFDAHLARFGSRVERHIDHPRFGELLDRQDAMLFVAEDLYTKVDAPLVVLETLARGKPVFLLDRPPLDEIPSPALRPALLGADDDALIGRVLAYLGEPSALPPAALRACIEERFDATTAAARLEAIYARA